MTTHLLAGAFVALLLTALFGTGEAVGRQAAPKASTTTVTEHDVRVCIGVAGSPPQEQVSACTKIISSGKIHHPHEGDYYASRGAAYLALRQYDAAMADYTKALTFQQKGEFYFQRAIVYMAKGEPDQAKSELAEVVKLRPDFAPTYFVRGIISYQAADYQTAIENFDAAVERNPTYYQAIFARGVAKSRLGNDDGGKADLKQARDLGAHVDEIMQKFGVVP